MGSDEDTARLPPVDKALRDEFKQDVKDRFGTVRGHYRNEVEAALRAYLDGSKGGDTNDRLRRLENKIESIDERTRTLADETRKKKKDSDVSDVGTKTKNRLSKIRDRLDREEGKGPVHEAVVRQAIEDIAGGSDPTIRRYVQMLTDRRDLNPHPKKGSHYVFGESEFVKMIQSMGENGALSNERYWAFVDDYGGEAEWEDALDRFDYEGKDDQGKVDRTYQ